MIDNWRGLVIHYLCFSINLWLIEVINQNFMKGQQISMKQDNYIYFPMMTVGEAAKYLGVGRKVIYQMIEFDQIRAVRENRAVLVEKRSLDEFRASGQLT